MINFKNCLATLVLLSGVACQAMQPTIRKDVTDVSIRYSKDSPGGTEYAESLILNGRLIFHGGTIFWPKRGLSNEPKIISRGRNLSPEEAEEKFNMLQKEYANQQKY